MPAIYSWFCAACGQGVATETDGAPTCLTCGQPMQLNRVDRT